MGTKSGVHLARRPRDCNPLAIICDDDHLLAFYRAKWRCDMRRVSGHLFLACHECSPPSYMLVVLAKVDGLAVATVYTLDRESHDRWANNNDATPETSELLYQMRDPDGRSHNPYFQPATSRKT